MVIKSATNSSKFWYNLLDGSVFLRKNYFEKIVKYTKKVFNIERSLSKLSDGRKNPKYKTNEVVLLVLMRFLLRTRSFNNLNNMIKDNDFRKVVPKRNKLPPEPNFGLYD